MYCFDIYFSNSPGIEGRQRKRSRLYYNGILDQFHKKLPFQSKHKVRLAISGKDCYDVTNTY